MTPGAPISWQDPKKILLAAEGRATTDECQFSPVLAQHLIDVAADFNKYGCGPADLKAMEDWIKACPWKQPQV